MTGLLNGRKILVTGAARGIGYAIALAATQAGARVAINDISAETTENAVSSINALGGKAHPAPGDVSARREASKIVDQAADALGGLDGLVNNAGIVRYGTLSNSSDADWDETLSVNFSAVAYMCKAALGHLTESQGVIVNISSIAAEHPSVTVGSYSAAKAAVLSLTRQTAVDWGPLGIRSNAISPGLISGTTMTSAADDHSETASGREQIVPLRRTGHPSDVADTAVFLLSDLSRYVNGQQILVDGGLSASLLEFVPRTTEQDQHR
ncbi:MAG: SDR family NAD(P)-dependent oxidoreductase [Acidimicrobiales bacterium]|nr:SDR family NAD(P)-dependent oxidoreductase [Acidimicrobiales bacterium]